MLGSQRDAVEAECSRAVGHCGERDVHSHTQTNTQNRRGRLIGREDGEGNEKG